MKEVNICPIHQYKFTANLITGPDQMVWFPKFLPDISFFHQTLSGGQVPLYQPGLSSVNLVSRSWSVFLSVSALENLWRLTDAYCLMNTSAFAVSETKLLPPCSSTVFLAMGGDRFPFRERMTDHTWDKMVLPFMDSTKVRQLFCLGHLVRHPGRNFLASFQPLLHISANSVSQEVAPLHGSFQRPASRVRTIPT
jgi:hypothetical protein